MSDNIKEVEVELSKKVQEEEFEPYEARVSGRATVEPNEDSQEAYDKLHDEVATALEKALLKREGVNEMSDAPWTEE